METARLLLRRFVPQDAAALSVYRSEPEVSRYQPWDSPLLREDAQQWAATFSAGGPRHRPRLGRLGQAQSPPGRTGAARGLTA
uniref:GNAT family N-acetyltransferase n=1 Tax=Streptomyces sp. SS7 TaxID=3108485 RepID=UPI00403FF388